jgi:acetyltransferase-like isoleucine patch superfamily enzyme
MAYIGVKITNKQCNPILIKEYGMLKNIRKLHYNFSPWIEMTEQEIIEQRVYQQLLIDKDIASFGRECFVSPMAMLSGKVCVGDKTFIAAHAVVRGDISIGDNSSVNVFSHLAGKITIGSGVRIANNVNIFAFNHVTSDIFIPIYKQKTTQKGIII